MPIVVDIELIADRYDAGGGQDPRQAEWPPHPARVVSALRAAAESAEDADALRVIEQLPPPIVRASAEKWTSTAVGYVVTNRLDSKGGHQTHPGRTSGLKERLSVFPKSAHVQIVWDAELPSDLVIRLDKLAGRVPYLGRSTSSALISVWDGDDVPAPDGTASYTPCPPDEADTWLRVPYAGFVDELESLFADGLPAWLASDGGRSLRPYRSSAATTAAHGKSLDSAYRDLVVLRFVDRQPEGRLVATFTRALRSLVMSRTDEPLPPALHGHGLNGAPHVAYLGLPVVGNKNADGHLVALAVAIPRLGQEERRRILRGILGSADGAEIQLDVPGLRRPVALAYDPAETRPYAATPDRWLKSSTSWVTATPIVLDRYPKARADQSLEEATVDEVRRSCRFAGLPQATSVIVSRHPMAAGAVELSPRDLPRRARGRLFCHTRLEFDRPVSGPVLVGAGRYFGVGLLAPESEVGTP